MIKYILFTILILSFTSIFSQQLNLDGTISGYSYNPNNGLISKGGDVSLEGTLEGVKIEVIKNGKVIKKVTSSNKGAFKLKLPFGALYQIQYSKNGFEIVRFEFNLANLTKEEDDLNFKNFQLILNKYIQYKESTELGLVFQIFYNTEILNFDIKEKGFKIGGALSKKMDYAPLISLVEVSIKKNEPFLSSNNSKRQSTTKEKKQSELDTLITTDSIKPLDIDTIETLGISSKTILSQFDNNKTIDSKVSLIEELKKQLEIDKLSASTPEEFALIEEREALILALSSELQLSKEIISFKEEQLVIKSRQFWMLMLVFILVIGAGVYIYFSMRKKEQLNLKIIAQGNRIVSSINYAEKIQSALLPSISTVKEVIPNSFVLYKPKDIVSGDFYWVKEVDHKIIIAVIDCTGHGVPGAFMSMIGMTLMNQIVLIDKNVNPESILEELNKKIVSSLKQDPQDPFSSQDGMDLSIAVFDKKTSELTYAGAMNSIFMVSKGSVTKLEVDKSSIGGFSFMNEGKKYSNKVVSIAKEESLYLMSDGFMDQFGGELNEKYNLSRLEQLLLSVEKDSMSTQKSKIEKSLEEWQGNQPQTDDILLMGLTLKN
jgi:serine phosphatase RsbU (regulator of sigma subunit)